MAIINRFNGNVVPFASNATGLNRTVFGGELQSDNVDDNLNESFKLGWEIVGINDSPTKQDFNALGFTTSQLTAYLYQQGIAEWNYNQEYVVGSRVLASDGKIYRSLTGDSATPNKSNDPTTDKTNWKLSDNSAETVDELLTLNGRDEDIAIVSDTNRGGIFVYDSSKSSVNDGGITFNGWVRQIGEAIHLKWFNVKGDGTDESVNVQNAIDYSSANGLELYSDIVGVKVANILLRDNSKLNLKQPLENYSNDTVLHYCGSYMVNECINVKTSADYTGNAIAFDDTYTPSKDYAGAGVSYNITQKLLIESAGWSGRAFYINANNGQGLSFNVFKSGIIKNFETAIETEGSGGSYFNSNDFEVSIKGSVNFIRLGLGDTNKFLGDLQENKDYTKRGIYCSDVTANNKFIGRNWDWHKLTGNEFSIFDLGSNNIYDGIEQESADFEPLVYLGERRKSKLLNPIVGAEVLMDKIMFPLNYSTGGYGRQDNILGYADKMLNATYSHSPYLVENLYNQSHGYTSFTSGTNFDDDSLVITIDTGKVRISNYIAIEFMEEYVCTYVKIETSSDDTATPDDASWVVLEDNQGYNINTLYAAARTNAGNNIWRHVRITLSHPRDVTTLTWNDIDAVYDSLQPTNTDNNKIKLRGIFALGDTLNDGSFIPYSEARHINFISETDNSKIPNNSLFLDDTLGFSSKSPTGVINKVALVEDGTWTPIPSNGTDDTVFGSITSRNYTKNGNTVTVECRALNIDTLLTDSFILKGLPYPIKGNAYGTAILRSFNNDTLGSYICATFEASGTELSEFTDIATGTVVDWGDVVEDAADLFLSLTYITE